MTDQSAQFGMTEALQGLKQRGFEPSVIYDIGAASGEWTSFANMFWPNAFYFCFEPLPAWQDSLSRLAVKLEGRATIVGSGIGDVDGTMPIGVTGDLYGSSFAYPGASIATVPVRRLDSLLEEGAIPPPTFVKVDVQGFE